MKLLIQFKNNTNVTKEVDDYDIDSFNLTLYKDNKIINVIRNDKISIIQEVL